jgi:hypothetical protein
MLGIKGGGEGIHPKTISRERSFWAAKVTIFRAPEFIHGSGKLYWSSTKIRISSGWKTSHPDWFKIKEIWMENPGNSSSRNTPILCIDISRCKSSEQYGKYLKRNPPNETIRK